MRQSEGQPRGRSGGSSSKNRRGNSQSSKVNALAVTGGTRATPLKAADRSRSPSAAVGQSNPHRSHNTLRSSLEQSYFQSFVHGLPLDPLQAGAAAQRQQEEQQQQAVATRPVSDFSAPPQLAAAPPTIEPVAPTGPAPALVVPPSVPASAVDSVRQSLTTQGQLSQTGGPIKAFRFTTALQLPAPIATPRTTSAVGLSSTVGPASLAPPITATSGGMPSARQAVANTTPQASPRYVNGSQKIRASSQTRAISAATAASASAAAVSAGTSSTPMSSSSAASSGSYAQQWALRRFSFQHSSTATVNAVTSHSAAGASTVGGTAVPESQPAPVLSAPAPPQPQTPRPTRGAAAAVATPRVVEASASQASAPITTAFSLATRRGSLGSIQPIVASASASATAGPSTGTRRPPSPAPSRPQPPASLSSPARGPSHTHSFSGSTGSGAGTGEESSTGGTASGNGSNGAATPSTVGATPAGSASSFPLLREDELAQLQRAQEAQRALKERATTATNSVASASSVATPLNTRRE
jgi:hypothetical protein